MSYRPMFLVGREWAGNALRFATHAEAEQSALELMSRWFMPSDYRVDEVDDAVNYGFDPERGNVPLEVINANA
jgi:hypothetical protein